MVFLINSFVNSFTPNNREYKLVALLSGVLATTPGQAIVIGDKEKTTGLTYLILSRNTDIKQLCIGDGITLERLTTTISGSKALKLRLKEDTRLHELWVQTQHFFS